MKVAVATAAFAVVHSAFCSRYSKQTAVQLVGERNRNGLYRLFFNLQTVATLGALWKYTERLPDREIYCVRGRWRWAMYGGQVVALAYFTATIIAVGLGGLSGAESFWPWLRGDERVPAEPEAQGPGLDDAGALRPVGPFRWSRHPLNLAPVPLLWLIPRMTAKLAAFNIISSLYFFLGSRHEEARLLRAYGEEYARYRDSGCPFFIPQPRPHGRASSGDSGV